MVFEITARRIAINDDFHFVFAHFDVGRDVVFLIVERVFAVSCKRAVDIKFRTAVRRKIYTDFPVDFVKHESRAIESASVFVFVDVRLARGCNRVRIADVGVYRLSVAFELPV